MATTGELRAIVQELDLVDMGDAANYLGEEALVEEEFTLSAECICMLLSEKGYLTTFGAGTICLKKEACAVF